MVIGEKKKKRESLNVTKVPLNDVDIAQCEDDTIKCEKKKRNHRM